MSTRATVLYDAPGPKAVRFNRVLTVVTVVLLLLILAFVLVKLNDGGQLDKAKWEIFFYGNTWTTYILPGLFWTFASAIVSIVLSLVFGAVFGIARLSTIAPVRWFAGVVVEFFRSIPVLVLMIFTYALFGHYAVFPSTYLGFAAVVTSLTLYNGSVIAEILRSGIESLPKGQSEAASALGLSWGQMMRKILLPQAVAAMLPAIVSQMVIALKDSALGYGVNFVEVVRSGRQLGEFYGAMLPALLVVAAIMILINFGLSKLAERMEQQLRAGRARRNITAKVPHQKDQGLETKDSVNVDWHAEGHKDLRSTTD
ncbi:amino acid ABC transporter permease [Corynebacterium sp. AOP40-9SA-29]|uniref:amino acid ABC transporter permease n=1 Tax=Corynebacterium sp. AOP40-9SA-29 TaxID=3457677 RepID=UPI00403460D8